MLQPGGDELALQGKANKNPEIKFMDKLSINLKKGFSKIGKLKIPSKYQKTINNVTKKWKTISVSKSSADLKKRINFIIDKCLNTSLNTQAVWDSVKEDELATTINDELRKKPNIPLDNKKKLARQTALKWRKSELDLAKAKILKKIKKITDETLAEFSLPKLHRNNEVSFKNKNKEKTGKIMSNIPNNAKNVEIMNNETKKNIKVKRITVKLKDKPNTNPNKVTSNKPNNDSNKNNVNKTNTNTSTSNTSTSDNSTSDTSTSDKSNSDKSNSDKETNNNSTPNKPTSNT